MGDLQGNPVVLVFAGPNGSGKTTVTRSLKLFGTYINTDDLKKKYDLSDLEAAQKAEAVRNNLLERGLDFSFETVLSTERNLLLLEKAKARGYEVQCIYVLTSDENINVARVKARHAAGGHGVLEEKVRLRFHRALSLLPRLNDVCDQLLIYDNTTMPCLIYSKQGANISFFPNAYWTEFKLHHLMGE